MTDSREPLPPPPSHAEGVRVADARRSTLLAWLRAMRLRQWLKNLLLLAPLAAAHRLDDAAALAHLALAFIAFGLSASATYLGNDLLDREADRAHPRKRSRPFASGQLDPRQGLAVMLVLGLGALVLAAAIDGTFAAVLAGYWIATTLYSLRLKRYAGVDVVVLALLYGLRILAGGVVADVPLSWWLLGFALPVFLSLAMLKRYAELVDLAQRGGVQAPGRGYGVTHVAAVRHVGALSAVAAAIVLAFYVQSDTSSALYDRPWLLWALPALMLGWMSRAWLLAHRGRMHDDPVVFALRDRGSWLFVLACLLVLVAAA